jgi:predicted RNase H-like HicB family nuclease
MKSLYNQNMPILYTAVIEKDPQSGYFAYVPSLPGCYSEGETYEEAITNIKEATQLYIEVSKDLKLKNPSPAVSGVVQFAFV